MCFRRNSDGAFVQDLGIQTDSKQKFEIHRHSCYKAYCVWALFVSHLSVKILSDVMVKLNITLVCQIVEYNIVLWAPSYTYILDNQKIRIQNKATRIIPSDSHLPYYGNDGIDRLRHLNLSSSQQH